MDRYSIERRDRALAIAQTKKNIQFRIRKVTHAYANSAPCFKSLRRVVLIGTYAITLLNVYVAVALFLAIAFKFHVIGLDVCLCLFRCDNSWRHEYVTNIWNHTFISHQCAEPEEWTCQVQAAWKNCACNQKGTSAHGNLLLSVADCGYWGLTGAYVVSNGIRALFGVIQTYSMFKLAQYSPFADPVNLGASMFFCLPGVVQRACHVSPSESKTYFYLYFGLFFAAWVIVALLTAFELKRGGPFLSSSYVLPDSFMEIHDSAQKLHGFVIAVQMAGLWFWLLGVETHFKVTPRLREIQLKQPDQNLQQQLYDCEVDGHMRRPHNGESRNGKKGSIQQRKEAFQSYVQGYKSGGLAHGGKHLLTDLRSGLGVIGAGIGDFLGLHQKVYQGDDDEEDEVVIGDPIFINVSTGILPPDSGDGKTVPLEFWFRFKVDFVDAMGQRTYSPFGLPTPLLTLYALPGEPEHSQVKQAVVFAMKKSSTERLSFFFSNVAKSCFGWGPAKYVYEVSLPQDIVLGRHRLDLRLGHQHGRNSADEGEEADVEEAEGEEFDVMLETCSHHEVVDVTLMDPVYDKLEHQALNQALSERLGNMETAAAKLAPTLEIIFAKHATEDALEGTKRRIHQEPCLHDYYVLLQMRVVGVSVACSAIASGMVGNEGPAGATTSGVLKGVSALTYLGDNCGLPFAGVATALIGGAANAYAEYEKEIRVRCVQQLFNTPARAEYIVEEVARVAALRLKKQLRALEAEDRFNGRKGARSAVNRNNGGSGEGGGRGRISNLLKGAKDMMAMAEVCYADNEVKKKAEEDARAIVEAIMSGRLGALLKASANSREEEKATNAVQLAALIAAAGGTEEEQEEVKGQGGKEETHAAADGRGLLQEDGGDRELIEGLASFIAPAPFPGEEGDSDDGESNEGSAAGMSERSESVSRVTDEYPKALQYLKEGVEFTKTTFMVTYRYALRLNTETRCLEWSRVGGGKATKKHSIVLNEFLRVLDNDEKESAASTSQKVSLIGVGGEATFIFLAPSSAQQFKSCLQVVLDHSYQAKVKKQDALRQSVQAEGGGSLANGATL